MDFDLCRGAREDVFPFASSTPYRRKIAIGNSSRVVDALVTELLDPVAFPGEANGRENYSPSTVASTNQLVLNS